MQRTLNRSSWCILLLSFVIDMSTHERAFPSYNVIIGIFGWYCGHFLKELILDTKNDRDDEVLTTKHSKIVSLLNTLACFTSIASFSIIVDVIFCFTWGREIIDGDVRSIKFAFAMLILNLVPKSIATFCTVAIQIDMSESEDGNISILKYYVDETISIDTRQQRAETPKRVRFDNNNEEEEVGGDEGRDLNNNSKSNVMKIPDTATTSDNQNEKEPSYTDIHSDERERKKSEFISSLFPNSASPIENISFDGSDEVELTSSNLPPPPFSPGLPGLISPPPMKQSHRQQRQSHKSRLGVTPPKPPFQY